MGKVLLGAGGAYADELQQALEILQSKMVIVLLGYQGYPTPDDKNQIARVKYLQESIGNTFSNVILGFADHAAPDNPLRYALSSTAIGAGAKVLEKHLTLGQIMEMEDHESALNPDQFREFVNVMRTCNTAMGSVKEVEDYGSRHQIWS
jgi:N,N'-diacetyllegionaminate synthase